MRNSYRSLCAATGAALLLLAAPANAEHHVRLHWSGDLGVGYDDNVGNAAEDEDRRDSSMVSGGVNLDYVRALSLNTALLLRGGLQGEGYEAEGGLSNGRVATMVRLSHRPNGGFYMPTFAGWVSASALEFDSAMRDGSEFRGGLFVTEPLTTAISARLSVAASERRADSEVFDLSGWSAGVDFDWRLAPRATAYLGYLSIDGDLVSSNSSAPGVPPFYLGGVSAPDDALDGFWAYRVDAQTQVLTAGLNYAMTGALSLDAQVRRADASAGYGVSYERWQGVVSALMRF